MRFGWESTGKSFIGMCADASQRARVSSEADGWYGSVKCGVSALERTSGPFQSAEQAKRWAQRAADELRVAAENEPQATASEPAHGLLVTAVIKAAGLLEAVDRFKETRSASAEALVFTRADDLRAALGRHIDEMGR